MAFPAANMRLVYISMSLLTIGGHSNASLKPGGKRMADYPAQLQKLAGIRLQNFRHGTSAAQVCGPDLIRGFEKIAFFDVAASEVISVKIFTFVTGRSFHKIKEKTDNLGRPRGQLSVLGNQAG
jgi:hypothetical protein